MKSLLLFTTVLVLNGCKPSTDLTGNFMSISILDDITDNLAVRPAAKSMLGLYNLSTDKNNAVDFRYRVISDLNLVPVIDIKLPNASASEKKNTRNEPLFRERLILNFYDTVQNILEAKGTFPSVKHTECLKAISSELTILTSKKSEKKILFVYSDLFEKSSIWDTYSLKGKKVLLESPKTIEVIFDKTGLIPSSLVGIEVAFIYRPVTVDEDRKFNAMVGIYRNLLQARGARCVVQASNNYVDL